MRQVHGTVADVCQQRQQANFFERLFMMEDWNAYRDSLMSRVGDYAAVSPDVVRGLQVMERNHAKSGALDGKTRELISLAVAVTTRCDGCIAVHSRP